MKPLTHLGLRNMIFLSSIPRSGSTLLTSLLNQRPDVYATTTSNLCNTLGAAVASWEDDITTKAQGGTEKDLIRILKSIVESRYTTKNVVFDKSRDWPSPNIVNTMKKVQGEVKIVATVRPVTECLASLVKIAKPTNVQDFCKNSELAKHVFDSYHTLKRGYELNPENFLLIEYDNLVNNPQKELDKIAVFSCLDLFTHEFDNVADSKEDDNAWGYKDLHKVRKKVSKKKYSARNTLGSELYDFYQGGEFWNNNPEPVRKDNTLDLQLEASLRGKFIKSRKLLDSIITKTPNCNRSKFNLGWFKLYDGNLQAGHKLLDAGRKVNSFGSRPMSSQPVWQGETGVTVLLNLEGGLGDQIHGYRFAKDIEAIGNRVIVSCSPELAPMFAEQFVSVTTDHAGFVYHDFYVPSMSAVIPLKHSYQTLSGKPYIAKTAKTVAGKVGVRWVGNPKFEHQQHRLFPSALMFDAVRELDCVSLQRDTDDVPDWMEQPSLATWEDTRKEISKCKLVVTSCTSIAHLAGAMGVPTWIVVPILPYYLWALPKNTSPYYDSVTLFRQEKYGDWSAPFEKIKQSLPQIRIAA